MYKLLTIVLILVNSIVFSQDFSDFLRIGLSAKTVATGNAATGVSDSPFSVYWNPGALGTIQDLQLETTISKLSYQRNLYALGVAIPISPRITVGVNWVHFSIADIEARTGDTVIPDFLFSTYYNYIAGGISARLFNNFYVGSSIKYISLDLDTESVHSTGVDMGLFYTFNALNVGFMLQDISSYYKLSDNSIKKFPTIYRLGASYTYNNLKFILDTEKLDREYDNFKINGGVEISISKSIFLRSGFYDGKQLAVGAGIQLPTTGNIDVGINYAYKEESFSNQPVHFFSIVLKGKIKRKNINIVSTKYEVIASVLNVRVLPDKNSKKIGNLLRNDIVTVLETKNGWAKIKRNNLNGWVSMDYIKRVK